MAKDYKKKQLQSFAEGGKVRSQSGLQNMMGNWQNALRSGNTGPIYVNPRYANSQKMMNNPLAAFIYDGFRPQPKKKATTNG
jgi:hypothetical protein